jgi:hypothetical protein
MQGFLCAGSFPGFRRWYPGFGQQSEKQPVQKAACPQNRMLSSVSKAAMRPDSLGQGLTNVDPGAYA